MGTLVAVLLAVALATTGCTTGTNTTTPETTVDPVVQAAQDFVDFYMPEYEISSEVIMVQMYKKPTYVFNAKNEHNEFKVMATTDYASFIEEGDTLNNVFVYAVIGADKTSFNSDMSKKALNTTDNWTSSIEEVEEYCRDLVYRTLMMTEDEEAMSYKGKEFTDFYCDNNSFNATFDKNGESIVYKVVYDEDAGTMTITLGDRVVVQEKE